MPHTFPLHRFREFGDLSEAEIEAWQSAVNPPVQFARHSIIRSEHVKPKGIFLLFDGWVLASQTNSNGDRQILKVHLPGDVLGTPSMAMAETVEELRCLTDAVVAEVTLTAFGQLCEAHPRLAAKFMLSVQLERVLLMNRLASIGQTAAQAQLATFILDLADRLKPLGLSHDDSFDVFVTQQQIGELLGLTGIHVNRMMNALDKRGAISRQGRRLTIVDRPALEALAKRTRFRPLADQDWLPARK